MDPSPEPANFRRADALRFAELRALDRDRTLCVCAVSALEVHVRTAPTGADELPLPGSIGSPPRVVYRAVVALGESLARAGFRTLMVTNAHGGPRHAAALEAAWPTSRRWSRGGHTAAEIRSIASDPPFIQPNFWR